MQKIIDPRHRAGHVTSMLSTPFIIYIYKQIKTWMCNWIIYAIDASINYNTFIYLERVYGNI
jgi:hypothetical protein